MDLTTATSPCRNICLLDPQTGFCSGCGRTGEEIAAWLSATLEQRRVINLRAKARLADLRHSATPVPR